MAVVSVVLAIVLWCVPVGRGTVARVYVDGACVYSVDLSAVNEPFVYVVHTPYGDNTLEIERGRIRVSEADCAGGDCARMGWISASGRPIVCTPHRLVVQIEGVDDNTVVQ